MHYLCHLPSGRTKHIVAIWYTSGFGQALTPNLRAEDNLTNSFGAEIGGSISGAHIRLLFIHNLDLFYYILSHYCIYLLLQWCSSLIAGCSRKWEAIKALKRISRFDYIIERTLFVSSVYTSFLRERLMARYCYAISWAIKRRIVWIGRKFL